MPPQKTQKLKNSTCSNSQISQTPSQFASRPFGIPAQSISTQQQQEDAAFAEQKIEATGLEIQAKHGTITPQGQERLTLLQAKMDGLLQTRLANAAKYRHNIERIAFTRPDSSPPVQAKLTIGQPGDKYEQEADETATQVVQRIHQQSNQPVQREAVTEQEELQTKSVDNIQRQELSNEDELHMKPTDIETEKSDNASHQQVQLEEGGQKSSKSTQNPSAEASDDSQIIPSSETQNWIHLADTAIKEERYQDLLKAYDEGIKLNPNITPSVERSKLKILEDDEQIPLPLEKQTDDKSQLPIENKIEIAQSNPGVFSNLPPWAKRKDSNDELQRLEAIRIVSENAKWICETSQKYNVTPDAIAGAILWEAIENPYPSWRTGALRPNIPGKIHPYPGDVAEKVEIEKRVPPLNSNFPQIGPLGPRTDRLRDPKWAITYIGAILDRAAEIYEKTAQTFAEQDELRRKPPRPIYNIRDQAGILGTLYHGGKVERRADDFEDRRTEEPDSRPRMHESEKMGPWISQYRWWIRDLLIKNGCPPQGFAPKQQIGPQRPLNLPIPSPFYPENS
jgi:hypothetical protein